MLLNLQCNRQPNNQCSPITEQMTLKSQFFLVNQTHTVQLVYSDSQINNPK